MEAAHKPVQPQQRNAAFRLQPRGESLQPKCCAPVHRICLFLLLIGLSSSAVWSSDFYLARLGPPPLRFSPPPGRDFAWPVPLLRTNAGSKAVDLLNTSASPAGTNSTVLISSSPAPLTNSLSGVDLQAALPGLPGLGQIPFGSDTNAFTASNLLNITPQMMADYFRATLENTYRFSTNAVNGAEIPFNPPMPAPKPAPSSEATYRVQ